MIVSGRIVSAGPEGMTILVPYDPAYVSRRLDTVLVDLPDGRHVTPEQNRKAWALMGEIAQFSGDSKEEVYDAQRLAYHEERRQTLSKKIFRLSQATVEEGREYINYLIDLILRFDIPTHEPLVKNVDDIPHYIRACLTHKKCAVCGRKAELHHVDRVGMGRDRRRMDHLGLRCLPLCREHHQEAHRLGDEALMALYHLESVPIDKDIIKRYNLGKGGNHE